MLSPTATVHLSLLVSTVAAAMAQHAQPVNLIARACTLSALSQPPYTCTAMAKAYAITEAQFRRYNPQAKDCSALNANELYCIAWSRGGSVSTSPSSTNTVSTLSGTISTATTVPTTMTTVTTTAITTTPISSAIPSPTQPGIISTCNKWYKVQKGDGCQMIADTYQISLSAFYSWNPSVGNTCATMFRDYYVCVGVSGASETATTSTSSPPAPTEPGTIESCKQYYTVVAGDSCWAIENRFSLEDSVFRAWNPELDAGCTNLFKDYQVCVGA